MGAMVIGLGIDLVEVGRVEASVQRYGDRFLERVFTEEERRYAAGKRHPAQSLAGRFAAKEAGAKALGTGISQGLSWHEFAVRREPGQPPQLLLRGRARARADALGVTRTALSMSHTGSYATAIVLLEGEPQVEPSALEGTLR